MLHNSPQKLVAFLFFLRIGAVAYAVKLDKMYTDVSYITG